MLTQTWCIVGPPSVVARKIVHNYTVFQTVQSHGVCSAIYGTVHYKEPLKSFDKSKA